MLLGLLAGLARGLWTVIGQLRFVCPGLRRLSEGTHMILAPLLPPCPSLTPATPLTCTPGPHVLRPLYSQVSLFLGGEGGGNGISQKTPGC